MLITSSLCSKVKFCIHAFLSAGLLGTSILCIKKIIGMYENEALRWAFQQSDDKCWCDASMIFVYLLTDAF